MVGDNDKVFVSFAEKGGVVKVTATHIASGTAISMSGPASQRMALSDAAMKQLANVLNKQRGEASAPPRRNA